MKVVIRSLVLALTFAIPIIKSVAQQVPQFSLYLFDPYLYNPAYAGHKQKNFEAGIDTRRQYQGFDGAPFSTVVSAHSPVGFGKFSVGGRLVYDYFKPVSTTGIWGALAYRIPLSTKGNQTISFALEPGAVYRRADYANLRLTNSNDAIFRGEDVGSDFIPDLNFGVYFSAPTFYGGLSSRHILPIKFGNSNSSTEYSSYVRHYFLSAGANIELSYSLTFSPGTLIKFIENGENQIDLNAMFDYNNQFKFGASYRTDGSVIPQIGFTFMDYFFVGYGYDIQFANFNSYHNGSHELMVKYIKQLTNRPKIRQVMDPRCYY